MFELDEAKLRRAAEEVRYLLNRGYNRESVLKFVADHHHLDKVHRTILMRSVFSSGEIEERRRKTVSFKDLNGETLSVDGYNVLIVIETMMRNGLLIEGDDGYIRDMSGVHGKYRATNLTAEALSIILEKLESANPKKVLIFFDKPVSKSGELAKATRQLMKEHRIEGDSLTVRRADSTVLKAGGVALTSDSVILQKARKCFDIAGHIVKERGYRKILKL
ncbi:MAG: DUF434 domain-containing protein [Candidatus Jordarchaeales archaeon]